MSSSGVTCSAKTRGGKYPCINPAKGGAFCVTHDPRNQCGQPVASGTGRCQRIGSNNGLCWAHAK